MENRKLPGVLCLVSSKKYPGQFTDQKVARPNAIPTASSSMTSEFGTLSRRTLAIRAGSGFAGDLTRKPASWTKKMKWQTMIAISW
jgi:hypothetical protein